MNEKFYWGLIAINTIFLIYEFTKNIAFRFVIDDIKSELEAKTTKLDNAERRYGKIINQLKEEINMLKGDKD
jgi:hypothetical protein|tara:strand:- start:123 stop:338 length:216 start_codon:yes stop_codon:yes gene_type:complete